MTVVAIADHNYIL